MVFYRVTETEIVSLEEKKGCGNKSLETSLSTAFQVLPNFHQYEIDIAMIAN